MSTDAVRAGGRGGRLPRAPRSVGIIGLVVGALAFWLALPPLSARTIIWPILVGLLAAMAGIWAYTRGERRIGASAAVVGVLGIALGIIATRSSVAHLDTVIVWGALFASMFRYATPLTFAAIGGMFSERSGVVNIGLEGMMLTGTFFGIWGADRFGHWYWGLVAARIAGGALALVHAFFAIQLRADQIVGGTAVNFLA